MGRKELGKLALKYKEEIYKAIFFILKDKQLSEDVLQDTFIRIINSCDKGMYVEESKFLSWAKTIGRNLCTDYFRKVKSRGVTKELTKDFELADSYDRENNYSISSATLNKLTPDLRETLILKYYYNLTYPEISKLQNCSVYTSAGRGRYGLNALRKMYLN